MVQETTREARELGKVPLKGSDIISTRQDVKWDRTCKDIRSGTQEISLKNLPEIEWDSVAPNSINYKPIQHLRQCFPWGNIFMSSSGSRLLPWEPIHRTLTIGHMPLGAGDTTVLVPVLMVGMIKNS